MTRSASAAMAASVDPTLIEKIRTIVGPNGVLTGEDVSGREPGFFMTRIDADAIVRPETTEEISQILALCNSVGQPIVVQGGMSGWVRATQTRPGEIILSLERMNAIESVDTANRTAIVQAGVILETFQDHLDQYGLNFPLDLGGRGSCQLGGNAATNAGGMRVIRYGMMREQVLGIEAVLADGRIVSSMNQMIKNNTGYDLKQLFIGSEGTLGVITRLVLRLRERPVSSNTALVCADSFVKIAKLLRHMDGALGGLLSAFELVDNSFYRVNTGEGRHPAPLAPDKPYYVMIEALGSDEERDREMFEKVLADAAEKGLFDDAILARSEKDRAAIWNIREDLEHIVKDFRPFYAFDVSLPVGDMEAYMVEVTARLKAIWHEGRIAFLGHVGDGNLHIAIGAGGPEDREKVEGCVYEPLRGIGGSVSAEHGIGLEKKAWFPITRNAQERSLMLDIKRMLDPKGILNPGKIFDAAPVSDTSLGEPNMPAWHEGPFNGAAGPDGGEHNVLSLTELGEGVSRMTEGMQKVGTVTELASGKPLRATVDGEKVLVMLVEGSPVAIPARCPHAHGPLHQGEICGTVLTCPWHGWSFDLATGACEEDPDLILPRYSVAVNGDDIWVSLQ